MNEPILVKAFDGLIGESPETACPAYSSERLSAAQRVRENLQGAKGAEEVSDISFCLTKYLQINFRLAITTGWPSCNHQGQLPGCILTVSICREHSVTADRDAEITGRSRSLDA